MAKSGQAYGGKGALELIDEAMHMLRVCPPAVLCYYFIGTLPFVLGFLFFWSDMSRSAYAVDRSVAASLVMAALYFWMKIWQGLFCRKLMAQWTPDAEMVKLSKRQWLRLVAAQCFLQALALPVLAVALVLMLPFGWAYAFFQNVTVLAFAREPGEAPARAVFGAAATGCRQLPLQNHALIFVGLIFALFVWMNVYTVLAAGPMLMKTFFGIESTFTTNPVEAFMNSTFFAVSFAVTFLCMGPLVKIVYTLRCYYGLAVTSGADMSRQLDGLRERRGAAGTRAVALVAAVLFACGWFAEGRAAQADAGREEAVETVSAEEMDSAIEEVITRSEYTWRLPRERHREDEGGPVATFFRDTIEAIVKFLEKVADLLGDAIEWLLDFLFDREMETEERERGPGLNWGQAMKGLLYLMGGLVVLMVIGLIVQALRRRARPGSEAGADGRTMARVDLESEEVMASQLPEDEWMKLAREQIDRGEYRLAVRALFLASLASLGAKDLLRIEKSKSNRDYVRELRMRARSNAGLLNAFGDNVSVFEHAWYGLHEINSEAVDRFTSNYRTITSHGTDATHA